MSKAKAVRDPFADGQRKYEVQNAADTLIRAEEIKSNKSLLKDAQAELKRRSAAIAKVSKK